MAPPASGYTPPWISRPAYGRIYYDFSPSLRDP
eukprot:CAMPEP_0179471760 /NCGR_PEP_ID=MMETSP0799-20121207/51935_1 /TAXON_ID=46947 /ORGANISM="Geminigera cryophila, Strain CCMP2564" /LENGTH=32 /DNA_ID= /DNA_START= /DNA_END= /DNA_ORIENTATION=